MKRIHLCTYCSSIITLINMTRATQTPARKAQNKRPKSSRKSKKKQIKWSQIEDHEDTLELKYQQDYYLLSENEHFCVDGRQTAPSCVLQVENQSS